ncbi:hypothetical protein [Pirellulimonas nuda]|uniref:hypothetical protein n=1 Tax=Pirellulimonas nuda TaxID=2528009 RepID=UPI0011A56A5E|nr:hypothetical protein [Pirellulimonas nuda]
MFQDDLDDNTSGWVLESLTGSFGLAGSDAVFGFDYSALGIPEAPNSGVADAATRGVRLRTNTTGLPRDQAALSLTDASFSGKYSVQVDMWLNWPPDPAAVGTTIHGGMYVGDSLPGNVNANFPAQRGAGFIADTDGDCGNCDYILLKDRFEMDTFSGQYSVRDFGFGNQPGIDADDLNTNPANGDLINLPAFLPTFDIDAATGGLQNAGVAQPAGAAGFQWLTIVAEVDPTAVGIGPGTALGTAKFSVINPATSQVLVIGTVDNSVPDVLDDDGDGDDCDDSAGSEDICVNTVDPLAGDVPVNMEGRIALFLVDFFAGAGSNLNLSFALFDNVLVTQSSTTQPGDFNLDGFVDAADYTTWRDGLGDTFTAGDYDVWRANFGMPASAAIAGSSVPEPSAWLILSLAIAPATRRFFFKR